MIKEADKGVAVVIINTKHYLKMISGYLNDESTYKMVESNCDPKVIQKIAKSLRNTKII